MTADIFEQPYYRINKRLLSFLGHWPQQSKGQKYLFRFISISLAGSLVVAKLIKLIIYIQLGDIDGVLRCLPILSIDLRSAVRVINATLNTQRMSALIFQIKDDWELETGDGLMDGAILKQYAEQGRFLTILYCAYMSTGMGFYLLLPLIPVVLDVFSPLNESRQLVHLYETEYFIDREKYYAILLVHAAVSMSISLSVIVAFDTMFVVNVHHACAIFKTSGTRLETVKNIESDNKIEANRNSIESGDSAYDDIVLGIRSHKKAVDFTELLEASGHMCYFFAVGLDTAAMTLTGYMIMTTMDRPSESARHVFAAVGELFHIFYICWQGNMLTEHSQEVFINIYTSPWYDLSTRAKKLILIMMLRCLEPCKLTAGKIFVLSMENFATVLKTSMSYFTVLTSIH